MPRQSIVGDNDDDAPSPDAMMQKVKKIGVGHGVANDVHKAEGVLQRVVDWERNFRGSIWVDFWVGGTGGTHETTQDVRWSTDTPINYLKYS